MQLKLSFYQFKIDCYNYKVFYIISIVNTKKIPIEHTQNDNRKHITVKKSIKHKESLGERKRGTE